MKTIKFDFWTNLGGISKIYAIPPSSFFRVRTNYTKGLKYLDLRNTGDIIDIYCTDETVSFTEEKSQPSAGSLYNPIISGVIPRSNSLNQQQLTRLESGVWLLLFIDNNDNLRLSGNEQNQLVFNRNEATGATLVTRNQITFTFEGFQSQPSCFIEPDEISIL